MNVSEQATRRKIMARVERRIATLDPFVRLYELGIEAGTILATGDPAGADKKRLEDNIQEARSLRNKIKGLGYGNDPLPSQQGDL